MAEKEKKESTLTSYDTTKYEYDFGPSVFTGEIANKEIDAILDEIFDEALGPEEKKGV